MRCAERTPATLQKRLRKTYAFGAVGWKLSFASMLPSVERICSRVYALSEMYTKSRHSGA